MVNFFLLNEAVDLANVEQFKNGMLDLVIIERENDDDFKKHESIWELKVLESLYSNFGGQEEQVIYKFIEQLTPIEYYIDSCESFDELYPNCGNAFLGADFNKTSIPHDFQVIHEQSFKNFRRFYYKNLKALGNQEDILKVLIILFPKYNFDSKAVEDITYWNHLNFDLYHRLLDLLYDIEKNPFTGGIGKTEVLKNLSGVSSKRLDGEHRITYSIKDRIIQVYSCKGHYE